MGCVGGSYDGSGPDCDATKDVTTTANYCNTSPIQWSTGQTMGKVLYVAKPCGGGAPFGDGQDVVYYNKGVSNDPAWTGDPKTARTSTGTPDGNGKGDPNHGN
jgi:hypothetical protein